MTDLAGQHCKACEGGVAPLTKEESLKHLTKLGSDNWQINDAGTEIEANFAFKNYYHTMAFVNAIAYMAHFENHHPDLEVSYNKCKVRYSTHAIDGLSENDFICAAKVDEIKRTSK